MFEGDKGVALSAIIEEGRLELDVDARDVSAVDVAAQDLLAARLNKDLLDRAVLYIDRPHLTSL